ncbi:MAG: phosphate regulon sensor histidine kinase PhoR [Burkholderiaceae bacterium]
MVLRLIGMVVWQLLGAALVLALNVQFDFHINSTVLALVGLILGGLCWAILNLTRASRVLIWLRNGEINEVPRVGGVWGEVADRVRKLLRQHVQNIELSDKRLHDFLSAIQASPNGVLLLDVNGQIEWCNLTAAEHFGLDVKADVSQHVGNLVRDPLFAAYFSSGDYSHEITIAGNTSNSARPCRIAIQIHSYGTGRKLMLSHDVTSIELSDLMRRDFVANVSHEIRTPLTVLSGFIETLQTLPLNADEQIRYLDLMAQQADRMQTLVSDLLILSKLEGSPNPSGEIWLDASSLMKICEQEARSLSAVLSLSGDSSKRGQMLVFSVPPNLELAGSQTELLSAMSNLINNAVRYTPLDGSIQVSWKICEAGKAEFLVQDSGAGVAPEHLSRLTERFYRVDTSRSRESGGTGLGLAIVKHVVQRHGGDLRIDSTLGKGSSFAFSMPTHRVRQS